MPEIIVNLHMHTFYSDGTGSHHDIAQAALRAGLDAVIVTDHNVFVEGFEGYYEDAGRRVLLLVGEEIHDRERLPQKSHLLVFGISRELSGFARKPEELIKAIQKAGGLAFAAHPFDFASPAIGEDDLSWENWDLHGLNGIEIWNAMSEFKSKIRTKLHGLYYLLNPKQITRGPFPQTLQKWDELLAQGEKTFAIGGTDAHAFKIKIGPRLWTVFPYEFHFRTINMHLIIDQPLSGDLAADQSRIYHALKHGNGFVAYDLPEKTTGFSFNAHGYGQNAGMGEEISAQRGVTLQIRLPKAAECRLICNGKLVKIWEKQNLCTYITQDPGAYRMEAYLPYNGRRVGWIFSNPVFVVP